MHEMNENVQRTVSTRDDVDQAEVPERPPEGRAGGATRERTAVTPDPWTGGATQEIEPLGLAVGPHAGGRRVDREPVPAVAHVGGHPLHPAIVPLPIGALTLAAVSDLAYAATKDEFWARSSRFLITAGLISGAAAGALGATDFLGRERTRRHGEAWIHGGGNLAVIGLSALNLAMRRQDQRRAIMPAGLMLSLLSGLIVGVTGWLGGELSYRHLIGVPRQ
jgi:uncharacterized membrane protein